MFEDLPPVDLPLTPLQALAAWPRDQRVLLLHSGRYHPRYARWSILALPGQTVSVPLHAPHPLRTLRETLDTPGFWVGCLSYDLGQAIEPAAGWRDKPDDGWPLFELARCEAVWVYDHAAGHWRGRSPAPEFNGQLSSFTAGPPVGDFSPDDYEQAVRRVVDYIAAGDVFQVNLAQRFTGPYHGDPRALFTRLSTLSPAWYGAYLELASGRTLVSTSPELFLEVDGPRVTTRPIKGTRPADTPAALLRESEKDRAELAMIVDLMRNDLGRVCAYGSVRVTQAREIETHPTVHHGVATVEGALHPSRSLMDLLKATLPGGSVTGAPKVRAMQIIDELEPVRRGPYCGSLGWVDTRTGRSQWNIAIRTILLHAQRYSLSVGGGIVADSDPHAERLETLVKARAMREALAADGRR